MATRTNPLVTAATLASAAAIAVASPAIAPSLSLPSPHALSAAKVQLATFADVLSVPASEWTDLLFENTKWGGVLSSTNYGADSAAPQDAFLQTGYVNPWADYCNGGCYQTSFTGAAYLFFDALVNGNGQGYDNVDKWNTGIVNYFWEPNSTFLLGGGNSPTVQFVSEGFSAATWYALQTTFGKAIPGLTIPIAAPFWGPYNVSVFYNLGLSITAGLISQVPVVGPFVGDSILAYLGDLEIQNSGVPPLFYQYGLSGALNFWVDIATGAVPFPSASTRAGAATQSLVAAASSETATVSDVKAPEVKTAESTPAADTEGDDSTEVKTPAGDTKGDDSTEVKTPESTPASDSNGGDATEVEAPESTTEVKAPESTSAVTDTPAKAPAVRHPVRDAVEKATTQITSGINDAKAKQTEKAAARAARKAANSN